MTWLYAALHLFTLSGPVSLSFNRRIRFVRRWRHVWPGMLVVAAVYLAWDVVFTERGVWSFSNKYTTGLRMLGLPWEEVAFFFTVPFACVFTHEVGRFFWPNGLDRGAAAMLCVLLGLAFLCIAAANVGRLYTCVNFGLGAAVLLWAAWSCPVWLRHFWVGYSFSLLGFILVNGVLTALPVVSYNDDENLGMRLGSIPVEDFVYSVTLLMGNVAFYEYFKRRYLTRRWFGQMNAQKLGPAKP